MGVRATALGDAAIAFGHGAAAANRGTAVGMDAAATGINATALGAWSSAGGDGSIAIGGASLVNARPVGASAAATDSIALGGLSRVEASARSGIAIGFNATTSGAFGIALGDRASSGATGQNVAIGSGGTNADASSADSGAVAIGRAQRAGRNGAVAIGDLNTAIGEGAVALGRNNIAVDETGTLFANGAVAIGNNNLALGQGSLALGSTSQAFGAGAVALGDTASANNAGDVALGSGSATAAAVGTAGVSIAGTDYLFAGTTPRSVVSVGAAGAERQLVNVAAGRLGADSTDAVNGSQLFASNQAIGTVATHLDALGASAATNFGGTAKYDAATGKLSAPVYAVAGTNYDNVGSAIEALSTGGARSKYFNATSTAADSVAIGANSVAIGPNAVANNAGDVALGSDSVTAAAVATAGANIAGTDYSFAGAAPTSVVSVGKAGAERQLINLAAGRLDASSTDAVNGSQLFASNVAIGTVATHLDALGTSAAANFGGTAKYDAATGKLSAPVYAVAGTNYDNVGGAIDALANGGAKSKYFNATSTDPDSVASGANSIAIGPNAVAGADNALALGNGAIASHAGSVALGQGSIADGASLGKAAFLVGGSATGEVNVGGRRVTGVAAGAEDDDAVNVAQLRVVDQKVDAINSGGGIKYFRSRSSLADAVASGANSIAIGPNAVAGTDNSVALGHGATTAAATPTSGGTLAGDRYDYAGANPVGTVSVGSAGNERQISNVAAGRVSADSTDAVNGSQLHATNQAVNKLDGRVTRLDGRVTTIEGDIDKIRSGTAGPFQVSADSAPATPSPTGKDSVAGGSGAVASGDKSVALGNHAQASGSNSVALGNGSVADRANSVAVGAAGKERQVVHVAAGVQGTDAVNVDQLKASAAGAVQYGRNVDGSVDATRVTFNPGGAATRLSNVANGVAGNDAVNLGQLQQGMATTLDQSKRYTDSRLRQIDSDIWSLNRELRGGTAAAMAMAGLPQAYLPGKSMAAIAASSYQGESGIAIGVSTVSDDGSWVYKLQGTGNTTRDWGASVGVGLQW